MYLCKHHSNFFPSPRKVHVRITCCEATNCILNITYLTMITYFSGIGYYTLPYLVHSGAQHVHACEWNPHAVEALKYNLQQNGVADRCTVHEEDNRNVSIDSEKREL